MAACIKDFLCGYDFDAVVANFRSHGYGRNVSKAIRRLLQMKKMIKNAPFALYFA